MPRDRCGERPCNDSVSLRATFHTVWVLPCGWCGRTGEFDILSTHVSSRARRPDPGGYETAPPGYEPFSVVRSNPTRSVNQSARPMTSWTAWSAWPHHPAILPPLPRPAKSSALDVAVAPSTPQVAIRPAAPRRQAAPATQSRQPSQRRRTATQLPATTKVVQRQTRPSTPTAHIEALQWPVAFDDWMIDIVRRRALRLNSGARRRGVRGTVRAVDLAHILQRSADTAGRWRCALCHDVVTLDDLSFDHVVALADGGEHAAHNLVPAHRKCNEIKGSEKAQGRAQALDRWLSEWATSHSGATPKGATRYPARPAARPAVERRYA